MDAGGDINRHHRSAGGIDQVDGFGMDTGHVLGQAGAEEGVNDDCDVYKFTGDGSYS